MTDNLSRPKLPDLLLARHWLLLLLVFAGVVIAAETRDPLDIELRDAETALHNHEYKRAAAAYRRAANLSGDAEIARKATRVAYTYGFNEDALEAAERWVELDDSSDEALLYVAQLQLRLGSVRKSRRSFARLLERSISSTGEGLLSLVPILSREDADDAYDVMRWLARREGDSAEAQYAVGIMALQAGDHDEALKRAKLAESLDEEWLKPSLLHSRALLQAGRQEEAIEYVARIVGDDPQPDPEARMELAILYMSVGRDDDALSQVNQILLEQPARTDALRLMAIINFRQENLDAARADFQDLLSSGRYTMDALYYLARIADYRGETDRALALYSQIDSGQHAIVSQRRASSIIVRGGDLERALDHLQRFGEQQPSYAVDMLLAQAQLLASERQNERSLDIYNRVVTYRPDSERVVLGRAEVMLRVGQSDAAIAEYRRALKRWPDSPMAMNALGYTLTYYGDDLREAAKLIEKAYELEPDSAAVIDSYGWVLHRQGKSAEALPHLERAWEILQDPEVAAHLVEVLWTLGRHDDALTLLDEAEAMGEDHPMLKDARKFVETERP